MIREVRGLGVRLAWELGGAGHREALWDLESCFFVVFFFLRISS